MRGGRALRDRFVALVAVAPLIAVAPRIVLAQATAPAQAQAAAASTGYDTLVREAVQEFEAGNFLEARTLFEQAHVQLPSARTLRGLGTCAYELRRYGQAVRELEAALADARNPLTPAQRAEVNAALAKARRYVGVLVLEVSPAHGEVLLDGRSTQAGEHTVDAGEHVIVASAPGYRTSEQRVNVLGASRAVARVRLVSSELSAERAAASGGTAPSSFTEGARQDEQPNVFSRWWFWTAAGVVVAGAAIGTALALSGGGHETADPDAGNTGLTLRPP